MNSIEELISDTIKKAIEPFMEEIEDLKTTLDYMIKNKRENERPMNMAEAAKYLRIGYSRLSTMATNKVIPSVQNTRHGKRFFLKSDLDEYLKNAAGF